MKDVIAYTNKMRTICEVLRECEDVLCNYQEDHEFYDEPFDPTELRKKLEEARKMAKRMNGKLIEYKASYDNSEGKENPNYEKNKLLRSKRRVVR